jgi:hypothetical protein
MAGMTSVSSEFASALILCGPRGGGPSLVSRFDLVLEEEPTKKPANHDGLWKQVSGRLDFLDNRIGEAVSDRFLCSRRVISEAARRQQIEGLLRDGRVVEEVYFSRTNAMPYGIIIGP